MKEMETGFLMFLVLFSSMSVLLHSTVAQVPGFVSIDCGGNESFTDELGLQWEPDDQFIYGETANIAVENETRWQYMTLRHFPADDRKYCYTLNVTARTRYLVRSTFLYGNFDSNNVYPKFDLSLGATPWSTIVISDADTVEVREIIFLALDPIVSVCLSNATTGNPFISTLELRQFNGSIYYTDYEWHYYISVSARINFGSYDTAPVRYPDDPFDRIWESDALIKPNYLVDVAPSTEKVSTASQIFVDRGERPPSKVMQTAVVGRNGTLSYRLNLDGFPGTGWAASYFAEIEDLGPNDIRKFKLFIHELPDLSRPTIDILENAGGKFQLYEPYFLNISLPFVLSFRFNKTSDSTEGPLLNAMEINKYVQKIYGALEGSVISSLISHYSSLDFAKEGGDPCLPVPWTWLRCSLGPQPLVVSVHLSQKNLSGNIPLELTKLTALEELWLDENSLTGPIPDFSGCQNLRIIHLENNQLTGHVPSSLTCLRNLREFYLQDNMLSGTLPSGLLSSSLILNYSGNVGLHGGGGGWKRTSLVVGIVCGVVLIVLVSIMVCRFMQKGGAVNGNPRTQGDPSTDAGNCFTYSELEEATKKFEWKIGSGGYGVVHYGKLKDGKEIAVKVLMTNSNQGKHEFMNEVTLLSRIHHRNLVQFLGYCQYGEKSILVYEYMHKGTLKEHLYGPLSGNQVVSWIQRLEIAEDAARGVEYLHTGCCPAIIHRDLKTSNILLDSNMRAKVSDFGLSKLVNDESSHVSSNVKGTFGYLDPEYYMTQQLTEKSDVYSFGVILLELISGKEALSDESFGVNHRNLVQWARLHIETGDIKIIIDPRLNREYNIQSMWKIAEKALSCVELHKDKRPSISEVVKDIQDAIAMEKSIAAERDGSKSNLSRSIGEQSTHASLLLDNPLSLDDSISQPSAR